MGPTKSLVMLIALIVIFFTAAGHVYNIVPVLLACSWPGCFHSWRRKPAKHTAGAGG